MTDNKFLMQIVKSRKTEVMTPVKPQIANASTKAKLECAAIGLEAAAKICRILAEDERNRNNSDIWIEYGLKKCGSERIDAEIITAGRAD